MNTILNFGLLARGWILAFALVVVGCGGKSTSSENQGGANENKPKLRGEIKRGNEITEVKLSNPLDPKMVADGKSIYEVKCAACHRLTGDRLVGPSWEGLTKKRKPVWLMNMITNVDMMLETDSTAQALLEQCMVRMPNQNVSEPDARSILEFMRSVDGEK